MNLNSHLNPSAQGRLWIKVIEARQLLVSSPYSRPYCVVEFEKNEFVTREATQISISHPSSHGCTPSTYQSLPLRDESENYYGFQMYPSEVMVEDPVHLGMFPIWKHEAAL